MLLYTNLTDHYQLLDYCPTHQQLLLRSLKTRTRAYNIDIIVKAVAGLWLPTSLVGLEITVCDDPLRQASLAARYEFTTLLGYHIFLLKTATGSEYVLNAMAFGVYHNTLEILETSLGRYDGGDLGEQQLWYAGGR
jgi:hypothetical protein